MYALAEVFNAPNESQTVIRLTKVIINQNILTGTVSHIVDNNALYAFLRVASNHVIMLDSHLQISADTIVY